MKKILYGLVGLLIVVNVLIWQEAFGYSYAERELVVHFLDVGQGDAIFIETPSGKQILIDGGPDTSVLRELGEVMPFGDMSIDMLVLTHGDKDHVGGFPAVLLRYDVGHVVRTAYESESGTFKTFEELEDGEGSVEIVAWDGQVFDMGDGVILTVLYPDDDGFAQRQESNNTSIVLRMDYGESSYLFTGDIEKEVEEYLVSLYGDPGLLDVDVLKVAHHGSKTSSTHEFLGVVTPEYAVVQVGEENRYGHPDGGVLERIDRYTEGILRTDEMGRVTLVDDGVSVRFGARE